MACTQQVDAILKRAGVVTPRKRRARRPVRSAPVIDVQNPNDAWSMDFKGWFRVGDGTRCDPLTVNVVLTQRPLKVESSVFAASAARGVRFQGVRARYVVLQSNTRNVTTRCILRNTSATKRLILKDVVILGANGVHSVLAVYRGFNGRAVPPLGEVELVIDKNIPGVRPRTTTTLSSSDVASVVVGSDGPAGALRLSAVFDELRGASKSDYRATSIANGYNLGF